VPSPLCPLSCTSSLGCSSSSAGAPAAPPPPPQLPHGTPPCALSPRGPSSLGDSERVGGAHVRPPGHDPGAAAGPGEAGCGIRGDTKAELIALLIVRTARPWPLVCALPPGLSSVHFLNAFTPLHTLPTRALHLRCLPAGTQLARSLASACSLRAGQIAPPPLQSQPQPPQQLHPSGRLPPQCMAPHSPPWLTGPLVANAAKLAPSTGRAGVCGEGLVICGTGQRASLKQTAHSHAFLPCVARGKGLSTPLRCCSGCLQGRAPSLAHCGAPPSRRSSRWYRPPAQPLSPSR